MKYLIVEFFTFYGTVVTFYIIIIELSHNFDIVIIMIFYAIFSTFYLIIMTFYTTLCVIPTRWKWVLMKH